MSWTKLSSYFVNYLNDLEIEMYRLTAETSDGLKDEFAEHIVNFTKEKIKLAVSRFFTKLDEIKGIEVETCFLVTDRMRDKVLLLVDMLKSNYNKSVVLLRELVHLNAKEKLSEILKFACKLLISSTCEQLTVFF